MKTIALALLLAACSSSSAPQEAPPPEQPPQASDMQPDQRQAAPAPDLREALDLQAADSASSPPDLSPPADMTICGVYAAPCCSTFPACKGGTSCAGPFSAFAGTCR